MLQHPHPSAHVVNQITPILTINPHNGDYILTAQLFDGSVIIGTDSLFEKALIMLHSAYEHHTSPFVPSAPKMIHV